METAEKKVYITINSIKYDCTELKGAELLPHEALSSIKATDHIEVETEGALRIVGKRLSVVYYEDNKSGMAGTRSIISLLDGGESAKIMRSGTVRSAFDVEKGKTVKTDYTTSFFKFSMNITGYRVINKLTENGGEIVLDYLLDVPYTLKERTLLTVTVTPKNDK